MPQLWPSVHTALEYIILIFHSTFKISPNILKLLQVVPEGKRLFKLLLRLVRQQRAILGAPHHICWVESSARPGKTVFYSSCLVTAAKEVRGAFKKVEISKSGRLPLLLVGAIMAGISSFKRKSSWMKWSPSQMEEILLLLVHTFIPLPAVLRCLMASLFAQPSPQRFFSHWVCLWNS